MNLPQAKLEELASLIIRGLRCECNLKFKESLKEPCLCGWVPIEDWFWDNCGLTLKLYRQRLDGVYREYEHQEMFGNLPKKEANKE